MTEIVSLEDNITNHSVLNIEEIKTNDNNSKLLENIDIPQDRGNPISDVATLSTIQAQNIANNSKTMETIVKNLIRHMSENTQFTKEEISRFSKLAMLIVIETPSDLSSETINEFLSTFVRCAAENKTSFRTSAYVLEALLVIFQGPIRNSLWNEIVQDHDVILLSEPEEYPLRNSLVPNLDSICSDCLPSTSLYSKNSFYATNGQPIQVPVLCEKIEIWPNDAESFYSLQKMYSGCIFLVTKESEHFVYKVVSYEQDSGQYAMTRFQVGSHEPESKLVANLSSLETDKVLRKNHKKKIQQMKDADVGVWLCIEQGALDSDPQVFATVLDYDEETSMHQLEIFGRPTKAEWGSERWFDLSLLPHVVCDRIQKLNKHEMELEFIHTLKSSHPTQYLNVFLPGELGIPKSNNLVQYVNMYAAHGGFQMLCDFVAGETMQPLAFAMLASRIVMAIQCFMIRNDFDAWCSLGGNMFTAARSRLLRLSMTEFKEIKQNPKILSCIAREVALLADNCSQSPATNKHTVTKAMVQDRLIFDVFVEGLNLTPIDLRLTAVKALVNAVNACQGNAIVDINHVPYEFRDIDKSWMCSRFKEVHILEKLFSGNNLHEAILSKSSIIVRYLASERQLLVDDIKFIWKSGLRNNVEVLPIVNPLVLESLRSMTQADRILIFESCILTVPFSNYDLRGDMLRFIYDATVSCIEADKNTPLQQVESQTPLRRTTSTTYLYGYDILWKFFLDRPEEASYETTKSIALRREVVSLLVKLMAPNAVCERYRFQSIEKCVSNLESGQSVPQSLDLLRKLVTLSPGSKQYWTRRTQTQIAIEKLEKTYKVVALSCSDLINYHNTTKQITEVESYCPPGSCFLHRDQLSIRFEFLLYMLRKSSKVLKLQAVKNLWNAFVIETKGSSEITAEIAMTWFARAQSTSTRATEDLETEVGDGSGKSETIASTANGHDGENGNARDFAILEPDVAMHLFKSHILVDIDVRHMSHVGFRVFQSYFLSLNYQNKSISKIATLPALRRYPSGFGSSNMFSGKSQRFKESVALAHASVWAEDPLFFEIIERNSHQLLGLEYLWDIALLAECDQVSYSAIAYLVHLHIRLSPKLKGRATKIHQEIMEHCQEKIKEGARGKCNDDVRARVCLRAATIMRLFAEQMQSKSPERVLNLVILPPASGVAGSLSRRRWMTSGKSIPFHIQMDSNTIYEDLIHHLSKVVGITIENTELRIVRSPLRKQNMAHVNQDTWLLSTSDYVAFGQLRAQHPDDIRWEEAMKPFGSDAAKKSLSDLGIEDWDTLKLSDFTQSKPNHDERDYLQSLGDTVTDCMKEYPPMLEHQDKPLKYDALVGSGSSWPREEYTDSIARSLLDILDGINGYTRFDSHVINQQLWTCLMLLPIDSRLQTRIANVTGSLDEWLPRNRVHQLLYNLEAIAPRLMILKANKTQSKKIAHAWHAKFTAQFEINAVFDIYIERSSTLYSLQDAKCVLVLLRLVRNIVRGINSPQDERAVSTDFNVSILVENTRTLITRILRSKLEDTIVGAVVGQAMKLLHDCVSRDSEAKSEFFMSNNLSDWIVSCTSSIGSRYVRQVFTASLVYLTEIICTEENNVYFEKLVEFTCEMVESLVAEFIKAQSVEVGDISMSINIVTSYNDLFEFIAGVLRMMQADRNRNLCVSCFQKLRTLLYDHTAELLSNARSQNCDIFGGITIAMRSIALACPSIMIHDAETKALIQFLHNTVLLHHSSSKDVKNSSKGPGNQIMHENLPESTTICGSEYCRGASLALLNELCSTNVQNFTFLLSLMDSVGVGGSSMFTFVRRFASEWEYNPLRMHRQPGQPMGLKNQGATCYMNSLVQQLYHISSFADAILSAKEVSDTECAFVEEMQLAFGSLRQGNKMCFDTLKMCETFSGDGCERLNVREQKDVAEFALMLFQKLEHASPSTKQAIFDTFEGELINEVVSLDPDKRSTSTRKEPFWMLPVDVRGSRTLQQALDVFVEGEKLVGQNQFRLDSGEMVDAIKRTCIKKLPSHLIFSLKRFEFDLQTLTKRKVNDYFEFPLEINMEPYTHDFIQKNVEDDEDDVLERRASEISSTSANFIYVLSGIIAHAGTADSGHYYSLIKERTPRYEGAVDQWFEYNDNFVWPYPVDQIPGDCFGGAAEGAMVNQKKDRRQKSRSAYMLVYDRLDIVDHDTAEKSEGACAADCLDSTNYSSPKHIHDQIVESNRLNSEGHNFVFSPSTMKFVWNINQSEFLNDSPCKDILRKQVFKLTLSYLVNVLIHGWQPLVSKFLTALAKKAESLLDGNSGSSVWVLSQASQWFPPIYERAQWASESFTSIFVKALHEIPFGRTPSASIARQFVGTVVQQFRNHQNYLYIQTILHYSRVGDAECSELVDKGALDALIQGFSAGGKYDYPKYFEILCALIKFAPTGIIRNVSFWSKINESNAPHAKKLLTKILQSYVDGGNLFIAMCLAEVGKLTLDQSFSSPAAIKWLVYVRYLLMHPNIPEQITLEWSNIVVPKLVEYLERVHVVKGDDALKFVYYTSKMLLQCSLSSKIFCKVLLTNKKKFKGWSV